MLFRQHPSYAERLAIMDKKAPSSLIGQTWRLFLFILYNIICLTCSIYLRIRYWSQYDNIDPNFFRYKSVFGYLNVVGNIHKVQESIFFRKIVVDHPSLEIGVCRGDISALHFAGKHFTCGSEYIYFIGAQAVRNFNLWDLVISEDLIALAHKDKIFSNISLVHTIDHVEDVDTVLQELSRILKTGGWLYFSGYTNYLFRQDACAWFLKFINKTLTDKYTKMLAKRRHYYNLFSRDDWDALLKMHGLKLVKFAYFDGGPCRFVKHFLHHYLFAGQCFEFRFINTLKKYKFLEKIFTFYYVSIGLPIYRMTVEGNIDWGSDFFIAVQKIND